MLAQRHVRFRPPPPTCRHALQAGGAEGLNHEHVHQLAVLALAEAVGKALRGEGAAGCRPPAGIGSAGTADAGLRRRGARGVAAAARATTVQAVCTACMPAGGDLLRRQQWRAAQAAWGPAARSCCTHQAAVGFHVDVHCCGCPHYQPAARERGPGGRERRPGRAAAAEPPARADGGRHGCESKLIEVELAGTERLMARACRKLPGDRRLLKRWWVCARLSTIQGVSCKRGDSFNACDGASRWRMPCGGERAAAGRAADACCNPTPVSGPCEGVAPPDRLVTPRASCVRRHNLSVWRIRVIWATAPPLPAAGVRPPLAAPPVAPCSECGRHMLPCGR
jgi:hypothetical protein